MLKKLISGSGKGGTKMMNSYERCEMYMRYKQHAGDLAASSMARVNTQQSAVVMEGSGPNKMTPHGGKK